MCIDALIFVLGAVLGSLVTFILCKTKGKYLGDLYIDGSDIYMQISENSMEELTKRKDAKLRIHRKK